VTGEKELETVKPGIYGILAKFQKTTAFLPDYNFRKTETGDETTREENNRKGTSISGILGGIITLVLVFVIGLMLKSLKPKKVTCCLQSITLRLISSDSICWPTATA
jgi:cobalt/nickel transport system permease protein